MNYDSFHHFRTGFARKSISSLYDVRVAQLVSASPLHGEGPRFKPGREHFLICADLFGTINAIDEAHRNTF
jgi:hypothetical protein